MDGLTPYYIEQLLNDGGHIRVLATSAVEAWQDWNKLISRANGHEDGPDLLPFPQPPRMRATYLNERAIWYACNEFTSWPDVKIHKSHQTTMLTINDEINLRLKKLGRNGRPMNIRTHRNVKIFEQGLQPYLHEQYSRWINVTFGWNLNRHKAIAALAIINEYGGRVNWRIDISINEAMEVATDTIKQLPLANVAPAEVPNYQLAVSSEAAAKRKKLTDAQDGTNDGNTGR